MSSENAIEMFVGGLVLDPATQAPIVILKDESGKVVLPIWIGMAEATSIASIMKNLTLQRPMTHDLMMEAFSQMGAKVERAMIVDLKDSTYFAELVVVIGERAIILDARPSDAIALALRASAPIFVAEHVLEQARVALNMEGDASSSQEGGEGKTEEESSPSAEESTDISQQSEKDFKHIDKDKWAEILSELDPDDFKYKM